MASLFWKRSLLSSPVHDLKKPSVTQKATASFQHRFLQNWSTDSFLSSRFHPLQRAWPRIGSSPISRHITSNTLPVLRVQIPNSVAAYGSSYVSFGHIEATMYHFIKQDYQMFSELKQDSSPSLHRSCSFKFQVCLVWYCWDHHQS